MDPNRFGTNHQLKIAARDQAYQRMWYDMYRSMMRRDPEAYADRLGLDPQDIEEIQRYYKIEEESELSVRFVTINLSPDYDQEKALYNLNRCLKKCYVSDWQYCFEVGHKGQHPHYHVIFVSAIKWLDKGRIIREWSAVFGIDRSFINVKATNKSHISHLEGYITKEGIVHKKTKK